MSDKPTSKPPKPARKPPAKPTLLSGGNPQIPKGYGDAPVQAYIAAIPGWKHDVGRRLDALITRTVPGVRKGGQMELAPLWRRGRGPWLVPQLPLLHEIREGGLLPRHFPPPRPSRRVHQEDVRYLHIHEDDELDEPQLTAW